MKTNIEQLVEDGFRCVDNYETYWVMQKDDKRLLYDLDTDRILHFVEMSEAYEEPETL